MLGIFKTEEGKVTRIDSIVPGCWVNLIHPTSEELDRVIGETGVEADFIRAALDPEESSRVEIEEDQTLLIVDVPTIEKEMENEDGAHMFSTLPLSIIILPEQVVTVSLQDTVVLRSISEGMVKNIHTAMKTRFVFQILLRVAGRFLKNLRLIERDFNKIEQRLYDSLKNEELLSLLGLSKSLVYFSASLKGNEVTMEKVLRGRILKLYEDDRDILEDALIEIRQAIEMAGIYSSILSGTMDAYASVVSNNLNMIMKILALITIIMSVPNIIFGFYGMNITGNRIPFATWWWAPILITIIGCFVAWYYMKRRDLM